MPHPPIHVAVAVIENPRGEFLLARRPEHVHQGGLWEFPGGKVEPGEDIRVALDRELHEELGITAQHARPLLRVRHNYPDKSVLLDVWRVTAIHGTPHGREGQPLAWVAPSELRTYQFPLANAPIVSAALLPSVYLITGEPEADTAQFLQRLERVVSLGVRLVQLRAKSLDADRYRALAHDALHVCRAHHAQLLLNCEPELAAELSAAGVHLSSARLAALRERPLPRTQWVAASVHSLDQLRQAQAIDVDFVVVSPVLPTRSHPGAVPLGWDGLRAMTESAAVPVFALGGMNAEQLWRSYEHGAQGVAVLSGIWSADDVAARVREFLSRIQ
ncbi:MAG: Nudix family hydrolase [Gammaproteobacteria bacterium]|nr:Nudix family hydrolase [Gammaproteobacteria bacterium]